MSTQITLAGGAVAMVDAVDGDLAAASWFRNANGYAICNIGARPGRQTARMHRIIMRRVLGRELERWEMVDHIDGDPLNNRRGNLRLATNSQNQFNRDLPAHNRTGYKGVSLNSPSCTQRPYQAAIMVNRKKIYLGSYPTAQEAARAYDDAARRLAGEYARGNFS